MNKIYVDIDFTNGTLDKTGIDLITGDYASTEIEFTFDESHSTGRKDFEMKSPSGQLVMVKEIVDNKILLTAKDENENNVSLFSESGYYIFEVSYYDNGSKLTSVKGRIPVEQEQVVIDGEVITPYLPIFDQLMQDISEIDTNISNIQEDIETIQENINSLDSNVQDLQNTKQDNLVSGENIKTINNESLLGSGNLEVITDLSDYYTKEQTDDLLDNKVDNSTLNNYYQKNETYNKNEIDSIKTTIEGEIPTSTSDLENDSGFITKSVNDLENYSKTTEMNSAISNAVSTETTNRQNSDTNLQNQIDAITSASDVVDVVSTYQELQNYDTSKLTDKDVIKVMQDSTHNNALSYYRWNTTSFVYVGSEGPFYTKGETDTLLNQKANTSDIPDLTDYVKNTDYATSSKGGVIKGNLNSFNINSSGQPSASTLTYNNYTSGANYIFISKGTLENVITGKELVNQTTLNESQEEQNETINELETKLQETQAELERYKLIENALPKVSGTGTSITLDNTANAGMTLELNPSELEQETTTGKNLANIDSGLSASLTKSDNVYTMTKTSNSRFSNDITAVVSANTQVIFQYNVISSSITPSTATKYLGIIVYYEDDTTDLVILWNAQTEGLKTTTFTPTKNITKIRLYLDDGYDANSNIVFKEFMLSTSGGDYEPYTGGIASPNPQYPQDIHTISGSNKVVVEESNLFDESEILNANGWIYSNSYYTGNISNLRAYFQTLSYNNRFKENTQYTFKWTGYLGTATNVRFLITYTDNTTSPMANIQTTTEGTFTGTSLSGKTIKRIDFDYGNSGTLFIKNIMLNTGSTAQPYEPHQEQIAQLNLGSLTKNMFNVTAFEKLLVSGKILNDSGVETSDSISSYSKYLIPVQANTNYFIKGYFQRIYYYDSNKTFLSRSSANNSLREIEYTPTSNGYIGFQIGNSTWASNKGQEQVEIGTSASSYVPFIPIEYSAIGNYKDEFYKATDSDTSLVSGKWYLKKNIGKDIVNIGSTVTYQSKISGVMSLSSKIRSANSGLYCSNAKWINRSLVNANTNECYDNESNIVFVGTAEDTLATLQAKFNGGLLYYKLETPTYTLLNDTLQEQLEYIYNQMLSYQGQTNISQVSNDLPFDIVATALKDLSSL